MPHIVDAALNRAGSAQSDCDFILLAPSMAESTLVHLTLLQELAEDRLNRQLDAIDSLDSKIWSYVNIGVALVVIIPAIAAIDSSKLVPWIVLPLAVLVISFAVLVVCSQIALRAQKWRIGAALPEVKTSLVQEGEEMTRRRLTRTIMQSIEENVPAYRTKVELIRPVFVALLVELVAALADLGSLVH